MRFRSFISGLSISRFLSLLFSVLRFFSILIHVQLQSILWLILWNFLFLYRLHIHEKKLFLLCIPPCLLRAVILYQPIWLNVLPILFSIHFSYSAISRCWLFISLALFLSDLILPHLCTLRVYTKYVQYVLN